MFRVRLSSVITGCGGTDTTRSRRSTRARTRSMNGISRVSCPLIVRLYRPSRSITAASACGISATDLATTMIANTTSTANKNSPAVAPCMEFSYCSRGLRVPDHSSGPIDMHDGDAFAGFEHITLIQWPRGPHLTVDFDPALVAGPSAGYQDGFALQRFDTRRQALRRQTPPQRGSDQ